MTTFALLHGAWHGAWSWSLLVEELEKLGHAGVAVDLPAGDPACGASGCADVVLSALAAAGAQDVVVVGHSLGGTSVPLVAERWPHSRGMIFLASLMPEPGCSLADIASRAPQSHAPEWVELSSHLYTYEDGSNDWSTAPEVAAQAFYQDCPEDLARDWSLRLRRQYGTTFNEKTPLREWPDLPTSVIVSAHDRVLSPSWLRDEAKRRLGVEAIELSSGHTPMGSQPGKVARLIDELSRGVA